MLGIRTILHPTDFSPRSDNAYRLALALARDYAARVVVLHVASMEDIYAGMAGEPAMDLRSTRSALQERLQSYLDPSLPEPIELRLREGNPATEILRTAEEVQADLIVIGANGHGGLGRLLLGSVAEPVMRLSHCPVLTIRDPVADSLDTPPRRVNAGDRDQSEAP